VILALLSTFDPAAAVGPDGQPLIRALSHHAVFLLLVQLTVLLFTARLLGEIARKLGQPPVVGELLAGVLLGPSVLGVFAPHIQADLFPKSQHQSDLLGVVSWIGVLFLLIVTGLETDIGLIKRRGKSALIVSAGGIIVPFATGLALGFWLPVEYLADPSHRLVFALFMAVAMSISAVPVIAKVLMDLKLMRRDIGQLIMASAMTDDTIGWILLSVVAGLATAQSVDLFAVARSLGGAVLVLTLAFTIGTRVVARVISVTDKAFGGTNAQVSVVLAMGLGAAALTHWLGIEAVLGAFFIGILVAQAPRFRRDAGHAVEVVTTSFLAPVFFAAAGVKVDMLRLADREVMIVGLLVLAIACFGKFVGAYLGSWASGLSHWERLAMGSGMNARGAMEIVVATVGLGLGVLTVEMYSIIVMVAIVTSLMAPPLLRWTLSKVRIGAAEAKRLEREEIAAASFVRQLRRVLLVTRNASHARTAAQIVGYLSHEQPLELTAIYARPPAVERRWWWPWSRRGRRFAEVGRLATEELRRALGLAKGTRPEVRIVTDKDRAELILVEAARGYDAIVVCDVRRGRRAHTLFGNMVDEILRRSPIPAIVVKDIPQRGPAPPFKPWAPKRIMVPTVGTETSRNAVEIASVLGASTEAVVTVVHVGRTGTTSGDSEASGIHDISREIVERQAEWGRKFGATVETVLVHASSYPEEEILRIAREGEFDLVVIGSSLRVVSRRAFFGHRIERILNRAPCPVTIVSTT
jgi:Kef-type K+ transport system membrane component KefB